LVKYQSRESKIAASYLATKKDITDLAYSHAGSDRDGGRLGQGWRHELVGRDLELLLDGKLTLAADPQSHYLVLVREGQSLPKGPALD